MNEDQLSIIKEALKVVAEANDPDRQDKHYCICCKLDSREPHPDYCIIGKALKIIEEEQQEI